MAVSSVKMWDRTVTVLVLLMGVSGSLAAQSNPFVRWLGIGWLVTGAIWAIGMLARQKKSAYPKPTAVGLSFVIGAIIPLGFVTAFQPQADETEPYCLPTGSSNSPPSALALRPQSVQAGLAVDKIVVQEELSEGLLNCLKLDVTLRSSGSGVHVVDLAEIKIIKIWSLPFSCVFGGKGGGGVPLSVNYQTVLSLDEAPSVNPLDQVDEQLTGDDTDRFTVTAKLEKSPANNIGEVATFVEARLDLYSNGSVIPISSQPFIFTATPNVDPRNLLDADAKASDLINAQANFTQLQEMAAEQHPTTAATEKFERAARSAGAIGQAYEPPSCPQ